MTRPSLPVTTTRSRWLSGVAWLFYIAIGTVVVHLLTGNRYGFHRDELSVLDDARHLAWGYIAYPPVTPFFARLSLALFGTSLVGFRFFAALVQALAVFLTGLMARQLGGKREAQVLAALAAVPFCLGAGALMQYISFDYICWVLTAYYVIRALKIDDPKWLVAAGAAIGLGILSKYTMTFFVCGVVAGMVFTDARRFLRSKWLWIGLAVSSLVFLPNFLWQARHHFVSLDFLHFLHQRDVSAGLTKGFLPDQFEQTMLATPLWIAGLWFFLFSAKGSRFRALGWMYLVPFALFLAAKGRGYYLAPAYPMLYAAGAVVCESYFASAHDAWTHILRPALWAALIVSVVGAMAIALPLAPIGSRWWYTAAQIDTALPDEIGWPEFVSAIAQIRDSLPAEQRSKVGILAGNYGEVGAINLYGPRLNLPQAISGVNSSWERGYGEPPPETLVIVGFSQIFVEEHFSSCRLAAHPWNVYGIENEETFEHPEIFVCGAPKVGWPDFWKDFQYFAQRTGGAERGPVDTTALSNACACSSLPFRLALVFVRFAYN
jgi:4-amino-4-deoxy-L-arabinose transferase-like glycosyltransferase